MILIYSDQLNPRIEYICRLIFAEILKSEISFTSSVDEFQRSVIPRFNYSREKFGDEFYIKPHKFIYSKSLSQHEIEPVWYKGQKYFFESSVKSDLPFDPLAASFYLVTRYEEYIRHERDKYNRYKAGASILSDYGLLKKPVVNIWADILSEKLKEKYPGLIFPERKFDFLSTIDIDNPWACLHKNIWRTAGAFVRDIVQGNFNTIRERIEVLFGGKEDPYYSYSFLDKVFAGNESKVIFFFLLADYGKYDKNVSHRNKHYINLIRQTAAKYRVGIHFSFSSGKQNIPRKYIKEIGRIEKITGIRAERSRNHFLLMELPQTYKSLAEAGIRSDFTMGYASQTGFRAGICTPYYFYDLENETATRLKIFPFQVMDTTLKNYMKLTPEEAGREIEKLMVEVKKVGGLFISLWHNEIFDEDDINEGYLEVFEEMNKKGFEWANE